MGYRHKLQTDVAPVPPFICMAHQTQTTDQGSDTESKFYLPAGVTPESEASRVTRLWRTLFNHRV